MDDRKLGYFILIILFAGLTAITGYAVLNSKNHGTKLIVIFNRVGNLKIEDAVYYRGTEKGQVESIVNIPAGVCVTLRVQRRYQFHTDYAIRTLDRGLMGDRMVVIETGNPLLPKIAPTDTMRGTFMIGVSEAIGLAWQLKDVINDYKRISSELRYGTDTSESFEQTFDGVLDSIDKYTIKIKDFCSDLQPSVDTLLDTLNHGLSEVSRWTDSLSVDMPVSLRAFERNLFVIDSLLPGLDSLLADMVITTNDLSKKEKGEWSDAADSLNLSIINARKTINEIRIEALSLHPVLF